MVRYGAVHFYLGLKRSHLLHFQASYREKGKAGYEDACQTQAGSPLQPSLQAGAHGADQTCFCRLYRAAAHGSAASLAAHA